MYKNIIYVYCLKYKKKKIMSSDNSLNLIILFIKDILEKSNPIVFYLFFLFSIISSICFIIILFRLNNNRIDNLKYWKTFWYNFLIKIFLSALLFSFFFMLWNINYKSNLDIDYFTQEIRFSEMKKLEIDQKNFEFLIKILFGYLFLVFFLLILWGSIVFGFLLILSLYSFLYKVFILWYESDYDNEIIDILGAIKIKKYLSLSKRLELLTNYINSEKITHKQFIVDFFSKDINKTDFIEYLNEISKEVEIKNDEDFVQLINLTLDYYVIGKNDVRTDRTVESYDIPVDSIGLRIHDFLNEHSELVSALFLSIGAILVVVIIFNSFGVPPQKSGIPTERLSYTSDDTFTDDLF